MILFRIDGTYELRKPTLLDAHAVLDDLIKSGDDKLCLRIIISGPDTWIQYDPEVK